jgi:hypothetical protein
MYPPNQQFRHNYFPNGQQPPLPHPEASDREPPRRLSFFFWIPVLMTLLGGAFFLGTLFSRRKKNPVPDWVKGIRKPLTRLEEESGDRDENSPEDGSPTREEDSSEEENGRSPIPFMTQPKDQPLTADELWLKIGQKYHRIENTEELGLTKPLDSSPEPNRTPEEQ